MSPEPEASDDGPVAQSGREVGVFSDSPWQMSFGERAALEGILSQLKPHISIEIGTAEGGSLERIAAHSSEVHSFDLVEPQLEAARSAHVTLHTGDSHALLPAQLERLAEQSVNVDFALVDGDHSSEGVRQDIEALLDSRAVGNTVILIHDTANPTVRKGLDAVRYAGWPKVDHVDLDFVPGYMFREEPLRHELWGGLGLVIVDSARLAYSSPTVMQERYYAAAKLLAAARELVVAEESAGASPAEVREPDVPGRTALDEMVQQHMAELEAEILRVTKLSARHEALWHEMMDSVSWTITAPLRRVAAYARSRRRG